ncbi:helix-turn-helix domain-containing protein [Amycolatopsis sp. NBC_01488]|uniref:helix-turn-helix domain-containing protein n=1 Tax=Amycolatopsis sp. NBC_01488 TaxID=2903563 RepID=UPI002E29A163|nr:helix-turn-helix domain-containing protein [Amycolatopsis sp. NBC_01488]
MYEEAAPPGPLAGVARCVWRSASEGPKRIVPDGCLDLVVGDGGVFVAGPDTAAWSSATRPGVELRGVRFAPGRAPAVLGLAADELRDRRVSLRELWGRPGEELAERLLSGELSPAQAVASRLAEAPPPDPAVAALIARLDAGAARVAEAVTRPGASRAAPGVAAARVEDLFAVSERRLRRRFVQAVGYGPATYLRVTRFQRAVALAPRVPGLAALAAAAGYADQAHLSRDCRALTGLTPRAYFRGPSTVDETVRDRLRSA